MELRERNFIIRINKTTNNGYVATVNQIVTDFIGREIECFFAAKFNYKTQNGAKKWALKIIN